MKEFAHAKWVKVSPYRYKCSACGYVGRKTKFCKCGCLMDLDYMLSEVANG